MNSNKKFALRTGQIVFIAIAVLVCAIMITIDCLSNKYSAIISTFLGTAERLEEGDSEKVEESAKSGDEVVRNIANEGVVLMKNDGILPLSANERNVNIFGGARRTRDFCSSATVRGVRTFTPITASDF